MPIEQWDPTALPVRPGLYINFKNAAIAQITGGERGIVAMPLHTFSGKAVEDKFYTVEDEAQALELFGLDNIGPVKLILQGGAKQVLVYTVPSTPNAATYITMREKFEAYDFNLFVWDIEPPADEDANIKTWIEQNIKEKKLFMYVTGGSASEDIDPSLGDARTTALSHDFIVNLTVGGSVGSKEYSSAEYAPYIAGLIAGTPINRSITYLPVSLDDVNRRYRNSEVVNALKKGSLVLIHDGEKVKIESAITTSKMKIRSARARIAIATDIEKTARDNYIGRINNDEDGQYALISAIKVYLETLEQNGVLTDIVVTLDPIRPSVGDQVFLSISYRELDSMERIFLSITV
ncbi:phage tail sheath subtilisin-like domain-containing protein [Psychrobacillus sp. FSL K6-1267]|uniref:phage tail sheath subtilisin-like domain-containing protein n=1 Tax=Psychrobacillus sp. FSL K6-1267 TaxID=2921543 RepID=UPI0030F643B6